MGIFIPKDIFDTILDKERPLGFSFKATEGPLPQPKPADRKKKKNRKAVEASRQKNRG